MKLVYSYKDSTTGAVDRMIQNFNPKRFIVRERFRFWTELKRQPGETIQELAAKIRTAASTRDFSSIEDTLDEALRTRFMCSVDNEAVLKSLFKIPEDELTFNRAVEIATEVEESAKVAKATVHGTPDEPVMKVLKAAGTKPVQSLRIKPEKGDFKPRLQVQQLSKFPFPKGTCPRCGKKGHHANDCKHIKTECNFCGIIGHLEKACLKKKFKRERKVNSIHTIPSHTPLIQMLQIAKAEFAFELDSGARDNFCSIEVWKKWGKPSLKPSSTRYISATGDAIPNIGVCEIIVSTSEFQNVPLEFNVTKLPKLNIIGRKAIVELKIDMSNLLRNHVSKIDEESDSKTVEKACHKICQEFKECFEQELGCLKDFELEVKFKTEAAPIFVKARTVPFSIQEDLNQALDAGIKKGIWSPTHFNDYGTPIVPIRKSLRPGEKKADFRICGDYSVTVNSQLEPHRYSMPLPCHLLEKDFVHFGYPHTLVTDKVPTFTSEEFQEFLRERGILHMRGAPYHPATNGQAERLVQTFKQSLRKSRLPCSQALQEFLIQYRRTPLESGLSPSELLNGRQLRGKLDTLWPSVPQIAKSLQKRQNKPTSNKRTSNTNFDVGKPCYVQRIGPGKDRVPRWIPAVVVQVLGPRHVLIQAVPKGPTWKRHVEQLRPRHGVDEDDDPGMVPGPTPTSRKIPFSTTVQTTVQPPRRPRGRPRGRRNFQRPNLQDPELTLPRRSERLRLKALGDSSAGAEVL